MTRCGTRRSRPRWATSRPSTAIRSRRPRVLSWRPRWWPRASPTTLACARCMGRLSEHARSSGEADRRPDQAAARPVPAKALAYLFAAGATLALGAVALNPGRDVDDLGMIAAAVAAYALAAILLLAARRVRPW